MVDSRQFVSRAEAQPPFFVGVDVGGTNVKVGVVDDRGRPLSHTSIPTHVEQGPRAGVTRMRDAVHEAIRSAQLDQGAVARIGLGTPGTLDLARGMLLSPGNLPGWWNFPIRDALSQACGIDVTFANDARAAAYGEFWVGSGTVLHSMVMFTLGTGVGGGIVVGHTLVEGENGAGSELGHIIIDYTESARVCSCGQTGHLEAYASASSVVKRTQQLLQEGRPSSLATRTAAGEPLTALMIDEEAEPRRRAGVGDRRRNRRAIWESASSRRCTRSIRRGS